MGAHIIDARPAGHAEKGELPYGARVIRGSGYILPEVDIRLRKFNPMRTWFGFLVSTLIVPDAGLLYESRAFRVYHHSHCHTTGWTPSAGSSSLRVGCE